MTPSRPARATIHRTPIRRRRVVGLLAVVAAAGVLGDRLPASPTSTSSSTASSPARAPVVEQPSAHREHREPPAEPQGVRGPADGVVPDGATVFSDGVPGVARLDPALLDALRRAASDAADEGVELLVDSGWRSPQYQQQLLDEAVSKYGSREQAARWVATPDRSAHVSGDAVDIGPSVARTWLSERGASYGLCQIYANEPWHYELRPEAAGRGCPPMYADPTNDPRMQP